ncbi:hypothetical protein FJT64_002822 [Amphibalanus amphitrite]|uniref:Uncharacterized protein n=1 Tax=Amphibalanus amphitrite TaxID=1232801 RepID=A0A6A4WQ35_AMPAM|nr:hypothetical protein FJT64_002822 [Amphibalanus amphitrite]
MSCGRRGMPQSVIPPLETLETLDSLRTLESPDSLDSLETLGEVGGRHSPAVLSSFRQFVTPRQGNEAPWDRGG